MQMVAELLDDRKATVLLDHYRDNEPVTDLEAELENLEKADSAEDKGVDSDRGENANDDKTADTSTEIAAPELTPEAAKQVRVELLKKFLEAVESKMKLAPAK